MTNKINKIENLNNVHLIDISKKMISKAKQNLSKKQAFPLRLQTLIPLKIIKFMILFFQICHCIGQKISQNFFFNLLNQIPLGGSFNFFNSKFN